LKRVLILFAAIILPLLITRDIRQKRKIKRILNSYREKDQKESKPAPKDAGATSKGWGMNNSPFRKRKSGIRWEGGNIKASDAARGERRSFMKR
jgi:hypothetical protein